jgi:hypothetical protein
MEETSRRKRGGIRDEMREYVDVRRKVRKKRIK